MQYLIRVYVCAIIIGSAIREGRQRSWRENKIININHLIFIVILLALLFMDYLII